MTEETKAVVPPRLLSLEERNDLRKVVLEGRQLSLDDGKAVVDTLREGRGAAALASETKPKRKRKSKKEAENEQPQ